MRTSSKMSPAPYIAGATVLAVAMGIGRFAYTPLLSVMRVDAGLTTAMAGILASANLAGYLIGAIVAMLPHLRRGRRRTIAIAVFSVVALTAAMAAGPAVWLVARLLTGVASGVAFVLTVSLLLDRAARDGAASALAIVFCGVGTGIVAGGLLVALFVNFGGSRDAWIGLGVVALVAALLAIRALPKEEAPGLTAASVATVRATLFPALAFAYMIEGAAYVIPATFLVAMLRQSANLAPLANSAWLLVGAVAIPSVLVWNRIARRVGQPRAFAGTLLVQMLGLAAPFVLPPTPGVAILAVALGATFIANSALATALARAMLPERSNLAIGLLTALYGIGQVVGPAVATAIALRTGGYDIAMLTASAALVVALAVFFVALALRR